MPAAQHRALHQGARSTHHSKRCNNPRRHRVSRVGREALAFAKQLANPLGASTLLICHYTLTQAVA